MEKEITLAGICFLACGTATSAPYRPEPPAQFSNGGILENEELSIGEFGNNFGYKGPCRAIPFRA